MNKKPAAISSKQIQLFNKALELHQAKKLDEADKLYKKLLATLPTHPTLLANIGTIALQKGKYEEAVRVLSKSLQIVPNQPIAFSNRGNALKGLKRYEEAIVSYDKAIALNPHYVEAYTNRGVALHELKQLDEAVASYDKALALNAYNVDAYYNRGNALKDLKRQEEALASYEAALTINPNLAEAYTNRGLVLKALKRLDEALESYNKAIAINPNMAGAYSNRGYVLKELKFIDEALSDYERAILLKPDIDFILGECLYTKMQLCYWDNFKDQLTELISKINTDEKVINPFYALALIDAPEIQRKVAHVFVNEKYAHDQVLPLIEKYPTHTKIRIGYFSADFKNHPVSLLTAELYERHDRNQFEIYAFSLGPDTNDEMNLRIKAGVDHFHEVNMLSDKALVLFARSLQIDIAVDLGGFTAGCRTEIFAMRVAPVQVNYLGYSGTMAADYMDYLIADSILIPENQQRHYAEKIVYMPHSYMVNDTQGKSSKRVFTRAEVGLPTDGFVFCCFNNFYKITPDVFTVWMSILNQVEGSVLWLPEGHATAMKNLKVEASKQDVQEDRLIFAERLPLMEDHFNRLPLADLFLDTLPYNAHTTSSDALRMGLPVLTRLGNSFASRVAASLLTAVNLPELITTTSAEYEALAIELATHPEKLKAIKDKLSNNLLTTPLYQTSLFTRHIESAYTTMYKRYQNGLEPDPIVVDQ